MDAIADLLDGPRARGAMLLRTVMDPPWSLRIEDHAPLTVVAVVRGAAWVVPTDGPPARITPGDVAVIRGPAPYTVADTAQTPPRVFIDEQQRCTTVEGEDLAEALGLGIRTWGNSPDGATSMLTGTYLQAGEISQRLLEALPPMLVLSAAEWNSPLIPLLASEISKDEPGQQAVLDRLLDLLLIAVLRAWFARPEAEPPRWYRALADPVVGHAVRLLQNAPAHPWTVATLAAEIGISRAALARRFSELVGEPPIAFLTDWRLAMAADLLREPGATIGSVAEQVGYGSPFALSAAFKRVRGVSPQAYRTAATAPTATA